MHWILSLLITAIPLSAKTLEKGVSTVKNHEAKPWFYIQKDKTEQQVEVSIRDASKELLSLEKIQTQNETFSKYEWQQFQTKEHVDLQLIDGKLKFTYLSSPTSDPETKTIKLSTSELKRLTLPPMLTDVLLQKLKVEPKLKEFEILVVVPDKMMLLEFNFEKTKDSKKIEWTLKPNSFFVGLVVSPVTFIFDQQMNLNRIENILMPVKLKDHRGNLSTQKTDIEFQTN